MFRLRYYQNDAREGVRAAFERHRSTAVIIPTAGGKTELYLSLAVEEVGRVLVLVHRDYLITSPVERLARVGFDDVAIEKAEQRAERGGRRAKIVFASVLSVGPKEREERLKTFDPKDFSLLIIDEGHRATARSYRRVQEYFEAGNPRLKTLILTATPKRKDGIALGSVCESVAYEMSPGQAAEEGWIVRPRFFVREVPELNFSGVSMRGGDFDPDVVAGLLTEEEPLHKVCASLAEDQGPTIVFCPQVNVAEVYAALLNRSYRPGRAMAVHQHTSDEDMERATKGLADGTIDYLLNVDKITEGYDVPKVVRVAWAAPTASLVRWTQGCGRGFRPDASIAKQLIGNREDAPMRRALIESSPKPFCSIVTYYPSNCQHQICTAVDLLGGKSLPPEVQGYAEQVQRETARQGGGSDTAEDIETAKVFVDLKAAAEERRKHLKARAVVADQEYDGLGGGSRVRLRNEQGADPAATIAAATATWPAGKEPSEAMKKWLRWKGAPEDVVATMTAWRAFVVRTLVDSGISMQTALRYPKQQALAIKESIEKKKGVTA